MKTIHTLLLLTAVVLSTGCLVRSIHPWLPEDAAMDEPALAGSWQDERSNTSATFTAGDTAYEVEITDRQGHASHLRASLHRRAGHWLLQVGPRDPKHLEAFVVLPGHILYRAELEDDRLTLYPVDVDSFEVRAEHARLSLVAEGSRENGYILSGGPAEIGAFLEAQLKDPGFFSATPHYTFQRRAGDAP